MQATCANSRRARGQGELVYNQPCKAFSKLFTQMLTCANGLLSVLKFLLLFDLPFPRLSVHRQTDRQTDILHDYCNPLLCICVRVNDSYRNPTSVLNRSKKTFRSKVIA